MSKQLFCEILHWICQRGSVKLAENFRKVTDINENFETPYLTEIPNKYLDVALCVAEDKYTPIYFHKQFYSPKEFGETAENLTVKIYGSVELVLKKYVISIHPHKPTDYKALVDRVKGSEFYRFIGILPRDHTFILHIFGDAQILIGKTWLRPTLNSPNDEVKNKILIDKIKNGGLFIHCVHKARE